ncbi:MAG: hypothetical protein WBC78_04525, partial [Candidatus Sulfotelmatobacter sp.]
MQDLKHGWRTTALLGAWIVASLLLRAQTEPTAPETNRAAQEAEQRVSLSAAAITQILRNEPGLLLAVKKALVRRAYEQGRLLDPADLTDDALFQLLQEDNNVRILATREIEDRRYVLLKPTARELRQNQLRQDQLRQDLEREHRSAERREPGGADEKEETKPEKQYWSTHEPAANRRGEATESPDEIENDSPEPAPELELDQRRIQDLAAVEPPARDATQSGPVDAESL